MLVSKRREPAAHPKRPAWIVFDLLNLIRLHSTPVLSLSLPYKPVGVAEIFL